MAYQQFYTPFQQPFQSPYLAPNQGQMMQGQQSMAQQPQTLQSQPQTVQNGDFFVVPNEDAVLRWPVSPGNLVTFKIENQPVLIEKSMGFSKFDSPHYDRFKLVREEMIQAQEAPDKTDTENLKVNELESKIEALSSELKALKDQVAALEPKRSGRKKEAEDNE